jgi:hypothetical protein
MVTKCMQLYRCRQALDTPDYYLSGASDGMAQNHTVLPWLKNMSSFSDPIPQHLQGCYCYC